MIGARMVRFKGSQFIHSSLNLDDSTSAYTGAVIVAMIEILVMRRWVLWWSAVIGTMILVNDQNQKRYRSDLNMNE